jgi:apolipoprotein N-acyltransferase
MAKAYRNYVLAGLSGLLMALAYPGWSFNLSFLLWIGLVPLIFVFSLDLSRKQFFLTGFTAGLVYFLIIFRWFWSLYPLNTLGIKNPLASIAIIFTVYALCCIFVALFWGFFGLICGLQFSIFKKNRYSTLILCLVLPAVFTLLEYIRSIGYGILWLGSGTLLGPHWTLGNPVYALADSQMFLSFSSYTGIYGIIFLVILVNFLTFKILEGYLNNKKIVSGSLIALLAIVVCIYGAGFILIRKQTVEDNTNAAKKINFAIIQTYQPTSIAPSSTEVLNDFKQQLNLLNQVAKEHTEAQVIVFPEGSNFFKNIGSILSGKQVENYFTQLFKEAHLIISGSRIIDSGGLAYSRVFSLDTKKDIISYYDKRLLTPGGEFLPYPIALITGLLSRIPALHFGNIITFQVGRKKVSTVNFEGQFSVAPIVCSEIMSPGLTRDATQGADIIIGMASYGIFHGKFTIIKQNLAAARFRAAENDKPIILAANVGYSYVLTGRGKTQIMAPDESPQILTGSIAISTGKSWYNRVGDLPIILTYLLLMASINLLTWFRKSRRL